jgi:antitoxin ParD1/3/4
VAAKTTSVLLGDHFETFIQEQVKTGRYGTASEVVRAALRILEDEERKLEAVRLMLIEGEESGIAEGFSMDEFIAEIDAMPGKP